MDGYIFREQKTTSYSNGVRIEKKGIRLNGSSREFFELRTTYFDISKPRILKHRVANKYNHNAFSLDEQGKIMELYIQDGFLEK